MSERHVTEEESQMLYYMREEFFKHLNKHDGASWERPDMNNLGRALGRLMAEEVNAGKGDFEDSGI